MPDIDMESIVRKALADSGAPIDRIAIDQNVAVAKGDRLEGFAHYVPGKGQFFREEDARHEMVEGDRLYRIDVYRIE